MPFPQLSHLVLHKKLTTENDNEDFLICQRHKTYEKKIARTRDHTFCSITNCDMHARARDNTFCSINQSHNLLNHSINNSSTNCDMHARARDNTSCSINQSHNLLNHSINNSITHLTCMRRRDTTHFALSLTQDNIFLLNHSITHARARENTFCSIKLNHSINNSI